MRFPLTSTNIPNSYFRYINSFNAETRKCPDPTAGSQILILLIKSLALDISSILLYKSITEVQFQP